MTSDNRKPIGAETLAWWASGSTIIKCAYADQYAQQQALLMEQFIEAYEAENKGNH